MAVGISTIGTVLKWGTTAAGVAKVIPVKTVPQIFGTPDLLETTDLEDTDQTFCLGVRTSDAMEFTANYTSDNFEAAQGDEGKDLFYQVEFGTAGADGIFSCKGSHTVTISESSVNAVREMTITVARSSAWYASSASEAFPTT